MIIFDIAFIGKYTFESLAIFILIDREFTRKNVKDAFPRFNS